MHYRTLGNSDLKVSRICLGSMTFGNQNSESEAQQQLDYALSQGVNFVDLAEMYPVPTSADTQGRTEAFVGNWMKQRNNRHQMVIATKVSGPADMVKYLRPDICFDRHNIRTAIEASLQRLQTDYIDLYQLHWPDRKTNFFGQLGYQHDPSKDGTPILETLQVLKELVDEGKIRYIGLSNESPWGVMTFLKYAEMYQLPRVISVQNPYSLLNRSDEIGLTEVLQRERLDLLAYSPLGFGVLSGKYLNDQRPPGARLTLFPNYARYITPNGIRATQAYVDLARQCELDPAQMALAYVNSRAFTGATIIGATTLTQLQLNIASDDLMLSDEVLRAIEAIHENNPNPSP
ncbi:NADP(H)-dependent aldo-keto reductase [Neptunomonas sp.]|uniref:NADP(H)-dependent aldo-keto reductase n=1 Tax=Neptunomonas sp. TaxID=1971898 RepID=UPI0035683AFF